MPPPYNSLPKELPNYEDIYYTAADDVSTGQTNYSFQLEAPVYALVNEQATASQLRVSVEHGLSAASDSHGTLPTNNNSRTNAADDNSDTSAAIDNHETGAANDNHETMAANDNYETRTTNENYETRAANVRDGVSGLIFARNNDDNGDRCCTNDSADIIRHHVNDADTTATGTVDLHDRDNNCNANSKTHNSNENAHNETISNAHSNASNISTNSSVERNKS